MEQIVFSIGISRAVQFCLTRKTYFLTL